MAEDGRVPFNLGIPIIVVLLLANALFVAAEFALITVRRTRIDQLAAEGKRSARQLQAALGNLDYTIAAAQLGITMASIALGFFGEPVLAAIVEPPVEAVVGTFAPAVAHTIAIAVAFLFVTGLHIVVGEFIPKTIALEQPERSSLLIAFPLAGFVRVFSPVIWALNATATGLLHLFGLDVRPLQDDPLTAEDLSYAFETSASAGLISRRELDLTRNLLRLSHIASQELMVPRPQIIAFATSASWEEIAARFSRQPLTRYPVYEGTIDSIIGILEAKWLLMAGDEATRRRWQDHVQPAIVLPETVTADVALQTIRRRGRPMAILVDEYGVTAGLLTQFDIVRFLAQDLPESFPYDERRVTSWNRESPLVLSGLTPLSEIRELLALDILESEAVTVGGFVTELRQQIPAVGDAVSYDGITFTVVEMDQYRVARVQLEVDQQHADLVTTNGVREHAR